MHETWKCEGDSPPGVRTDYCQRTKISISVSEFTRLATLPLLPRTSVDPWHFY